jgi:DNA (cytosine-5)-methyltransferase 1
LRRKTHREPRLRAVSLFSNCGAGDLGFASAGFEFSVMAELDPRRLGVALLNHRSAVGVPGDLRETLPQVIDAYRNNAGEAPPALLAACPPCQGLSSAQSARGLEEDADAGSRDHRNLLVEVIASAAEQLKPRILVVENVQAFLTRKVRDPRTCEPVSAASFLIDVLSKEYQAYPLLTDLADFGVPQSRKRCFLTFIRRSEPAIEALADAGWSPYHRPSHAPEVRGHITLKDALSSFGLPALDARSTGEASSDVRFHAVPVWPEERYRMVSAIPPGSGLSAWENDECLRCGRRTRDKTRVRCSMCHTVLPRPVTKSRGHVPPQELRLVSGFHTSYRRMNPDIPASTVTTASGHLGSDRTIHPWENRVLSPLECALLQTFPRSFHWGDALEAWGHTNVRAMIGEAVPPQFTRSHGRVLARLLSAAAPRTALSATDSRVIAAERALSRSRRSATEALAGTIIDVAAGC